MEDNLMDDASFQELLKETMEAEGQDRGWTPAEIWEGDDQVKKGAAFLYSVHSLLKSESGSDGWIDTYTDGPGDQQIDLWREHPKKKAIQIIQTKYRKNFRSQAYEDFLAAPGRHQSEKWRKAITSETVKGLFEGFETKLENGWTITYRYITQAKFNPTAQRAFALASTKCDKLGVTLEYLDKDGLKAKFSDADSKDRTSLSIELDVPAERLLILETTSRRSLLAIIEATEMLDFYQSLGGDKHKLFNANIRSALGVKGEVNKKIIESTRTPTDFYFKNNGLAALCTKFTHVDGTLKADDFQIINGAQTVSSLSNSEVTRADCKEILLSLKLTELEEVRTDKGLGAQIVLANNNQNKMSRGAFVTNDPIHEWLRNNFHQADKRYLPVIRNFWYKHKDGIHRPEQCAGKGLKMEDFAKMRYAYLVDPLAVTTDSYRLTAYQHDIYKAAFASAPGNFQKSWTKTVLAQAFFIYAIYLELEKRTREDKKDSKWNEYFLMRWHYLALIGLYYRETDKKYSNDELKAVLVEREELLKDQEKFEEMVDRLYSLSRELLKEPISVQVSVFGSLSPRKIQQDKEIWRKASESMEQYASS